MRTLFLLLGMLLVLIPASLAVANGGRPRATSPACPLKCPAGYQVAAYTWELHAERTNYDEKGQAKVADDSLWPVTCSLRCEQHAFNQETKLVNSTRELCKSGAEPAPYRGPWRIVGPFSRQCASLTADGCGMQCYAPRPAPSVRRRGKK